MVDGFQGLGHDPVIGGDNQNNDIGNLGAARPHGGKRLMSGRVQKGNMTFVGGNMISADMLGNPSGFHIGDPGFTNHIEQRSFTMIDMPHNGYHRWSFLQLLGIVGFLFQYLFFLEGGTRTLDFIIKFGRHQGRCIIVDTLVDSGHKTQAHESSDHFAGFDSHAFCQFGQYDSFIDLNPALDGFGRGYLGFLSGGWDFGLASFARFTRPVAAIIKILSFDNRFFTEGNFLF